MWDVTMWKKTGLAAVAAVSLAAAMGGSGAAPAYAQTAVPGDLHDILHSALRVNGYACPEIKSAMEISDTTIRVQCGPIGRGPADPSMDYKFVLNSAAAGGPPSFNVSTWQ